MRTLFKVVGTSELKSRNLFVVYGEIVEGMLHAGMRVALANADEAKPVAGIASIDFMDFRMSKQAYVAIFFEPGDSAALELWRTSMQEGTVLNCFEPGGG